MGVELRPLNVLCNIQCRYCYQDPQRDAGNVNRTYDMGKMKAALDAEGQPFTLFGGEPLLLPLPDLEELWAWGHQRFGSNSVQTNGTLITDAHMALFERYRVKVGISVDGPGELNDARWHGDLQRTRTSTAATQRAIENLCAAGRPPSLIVTLHRLNATHDRLPALSDWIRDLERRGVTSIRLHLLESESSAVRGKYGLSTDENIHALRTLLQLQRELTTVEFDLFAEMRRLLLADDRRTSCVWWACDPYTTRAVRGIEGQGERSNCGRTNKDGVDFVKANRPGYERYIGLYHTPQDQGGCQSCRYFLMCKGQCPGTALDGDWRNRTEHCEVWKAVFADLETELVDQGHKPLSLSGDRALIEHRAVERWIEGREVLIAGLVASLASERESAAAAPAILPVVSAETSGAAPALA
jgi:uncharacterized protein